MPSRKYEILTEVISSHDSLESDTSKNLTSNKATNEVPTLDQ